MAFLTVKHVPKLVFIALLPRWAYTQSEWDEFGRISVMRNHDGYYIMV